MSVSQLSCRVSPSRSLKRHGTIGRRTAHLTSNVVATYSLICSTTRRIIGARPTRFSRSWASLSRNPWTFLSCSASSYRAAGLHRLVFRVALVRRRVGMRLRHFRLGRGRLAVAPLCVHGDGTASPYDAGRVEGSGPRGGSDRRPATIGLGEQCGITCGLLNVLRLHRGCCDVRLLGRHFLLRGRRGGDAPGSAVVAP